MDDLSTFLAALTTTMPAAGDGGFVSAILVPLLTLTILEIVLGIDNVIFIAILSSKLPVHQQAKARQLGIGMAVGMRILLLLAISWIMGLTAPLFTMPLVENEISGRDLILLLGGLFLIAKSTHELHNKLEGPAHLPPPRRPAPRAPRPVSPPGRPVGLARLPSPPAARP